MKNLRLVCIFAVLLALPAHGCASQGGGSYSTEQQRSAMTVQRGVVTQVSKVQISNDSSMLGPVAGGVAGGFIGSLFGGGKGRVLTTLGGAGAGALAGVAAEKGLRDGEALQIMVKLDNGQELAIVQEEDFSFRSGQRVKVLTSSRGVARVQPE